MVFTHAMAAGMNGIRTAGDLVARMQMTRGMKTEAAKRYVADKLKVSLIDLSNEEVMTEVRKDLDLGLIYSTPGYAKYVEAKNNIANLLDIKINFVERVKRKMGI